MGRRRDVPSLFARVNAVYAEAFSGDPAPARGEAHLVAWPRVGHQRPHPVVLRGIEIAAVERPGVIGAEALATLEQDQIEIRILSQQPPGNQAVGEPPARQDEAVAHGRALI